MQRYVRTATVPPDMVDVQIAAMIEKERVSGDDARFHPQTVLVSAQLTSNHCGSIIICLVFGYVKYEQPNQI